MPADAAQIVNRFQRLVTRRAQFDTLVDEVAEFVLPHRGQIQRRELGAQVPGEKQTTRLFDATGAEANRLLAASMQGSLTSSAVPWFHLKTRQEAINKIKRVQDWLEDTEGRMYLAFRQSNFYAETVETYLDLGAFGTGCMYIGEREPEGDREFGGFLFRSHPFGAYVLGEGPDGMVDTLMRQQVMTTRACVIQWTLAKVGERIRALYAKNPDEEVTILHAVYPRKDRDEGQYDNQNMPWSSCYLDLEGKHLIDEGGFHDFAYVVPRWEKTAGEEYGRGPGMLALPDIRTLNKADEMVLDAAGMAIRPPTTSVTDAILGEIDLTPGGHTYLEQAGALQFLDTKARFDVSHVLTEDRRARVQRIFFWEQLQLQQGKVMTATEVERRWDTMRRVLGPTLGRLESEFLNRIIDRCFAIMLRRGAFLPPPPELNGADLDIEYEGPLARSQKSSRLSALEQAGMLLQPMMAMSPEFARKVEENLEEDEMIRDVWQTAGAPSQWLKSAEARDAARAQRQEQERMQQQVNMAEQVATAAGKGAPMLKAVQDGAAQMQAQPQEVPA